MNRRTLLFLLEGCLLLHPFHLYGQDVEAMESEFARLAETVSGRTAKDSTTLHQELQSFAETAVFLMAASDYSSAEGQQSKEWDERITQLLYAAWIGESSTLRNKLLDPSQSATYLPILQERLRSIVMGYPFAYSARTSERILFTKYLAQSLPYVSVRFGIKLLGDNVRRLSDEDAVPLLIALSHMRDEPLPEKPDASPGIGNLSVIFDKHFENESQKLRKSGDREEVGKGVTH